MNLNDFCMLWGLEAVPSDSIPSTGVNRAVGCGAGGLWFEKEVVGVWALAFERCVHRGSFIISISKAPECQSIRNIENEWYG